MKFTFMKTKLPVSKEKTNRLSIVAEDLIQIIN